MGRQAENKTIGIFISHLSLAWEHSPPSKWKNYILYPKPNSLDEIGLGHRCGDCNYLYYSPLFVNYFETCIMIEIHLFMSVFLDFTLNIKLQLK